MLPVSVKHLLGRKIKFFHLFHFEQLWDFCNPPFLPALCYPMLSQICRKKDFPEILSFSSPNLNSIHCRFFSISLMKIENQHCAKWWKTTSSTFINFHCGISGSPHTYRQYTSWASVQWHNGVGKPINFETDPFYFIRMAELSLVVLLS